MKKYQKISVVKRDLRQRVYLIKNSLNFFGAFLYFLKLFIRMLLFNKQFIINNYKIKKKLIDFSYGYVGDGSLKSCESAL